MSPSMESRFQASIIGTLIGDSMGLPWEVLTRAQILKITNGEGVVGFRDRRPRYFKSVDKLPFPSPSDDYQHTRAMARSLIRCEKLDLVDLARELVAEYERCRAGWGGTTQQGIKEVRRWLRTRGVFGRDPRVPTTDRRKGKGTGNGPSMKIVAFALFAYLRAQHDPSYAGGSGMLDAMMKLGGMTHGDPRASIASIAVATVAGACLRSMVNDRTQTGEFIASMIDHIRYAEMDRISTGEETVTGRLKRLCNLDLLFGDPACLSEVTGTSCFSLESIPFSIATFLRHPTDFRAGILEAINAGGDTDSNAAIVGALIGANVGLEGIPSDWATRCPEFLEALNLGAELYRVASKD